MWRASSGAIAATASRSASSWASRTACATRRPRSGLVGWPGSAGLSTVERPFGDQVLGCLFVAVGGDVHVGTRTGTAHGDVGELPAATVGEHVRGIDRGTLHPVHDQRNAKLILDVVLHRDGSAAALYLRNQPAGRSSEVANVSSEEARASSGVMRRIGHLNRKLL
jgi:hypothetical protein